METLGTVSIRWASWAVYYLSFSGKANYLSDDESARNPECGCISHPGSMYPSMIPTKTPLSSVIARLPRAARGLMGISAACLGAGMTYAIEPLRPFR
jgi:hypothetical protein